MIQAPLFDVPTMISVSQIMSMLRQGVWGVPKRTHPSSWEPDRRVSLLNSVFTGLPMGSLMTWSTSKHQHEVCEVLCGVPVSFPSGEGKRTYLLDGQERVLTLFNALTPQLDHGEQHQRFYYKLGDHDSKFLVRTSSGDVRVPSDWVPLDILLDFKATFRFCEPLRHAGQEDHATEVMSLHNLIKDIYTIPVVNLVTDDLDTAALAVRNINWRWPLSQIPLKRA